MDFLPEGGDPGRGSGEEQERRAHGRSTTGVQGEGSAGGDQGRPDDRRAGERVRGPPEPDLQLEEAAAGRRGECV